MPDIPDTNLNNFKSDVLESELPVLVDLYATWCPPCKVMGQLLGKLAPTLADRAKVVKINIDTEPELAEAFGVLAVPTLVLVHHGDAAGSHVGLASARAIIEMVDNAVLKTPAKPGRP